MELSKLSEKELERVAEAVIFAADEAVPAPRIAQVYADVTGDEVPTEAAVEAAVKSLNAQYNQTGRIFHIHAWSGGYRLATVQSVAPFLKAFFDRQRQKRLSRSLLETLAILVYRQPVTKPEIDFVRGVDSDYAVRKLMEIGLVDVVGRGDSVGRPLLYGTTPRFLDQFGLHSLDDLPRLREIEELLDDPAFSRERARLLMLSSLIKQGDGVKPEGRRIEAQEEGQGGDVGDEES